MPQLRFLRDMTGSEDGYTIQRYRAGEVYPVSDSLAMDFFSLGAVEAVDFPDPPQPYPEGPDDDGPDVDVKAMPAFENKAVKPKSNKRGAK